MKTKKFDLWDTLGMYLLFVGVPAAGIGVADLMTQGNTLMAMTTWMWRYFGLCAGLIVGASLYTRKWVVLYGFAALPVIMLLSGLADQAHPTGDDELGQLVGAVLAPIKYLIAIIIPSAFAALGVIYSYEKWLSRSSLRKGA